MKIKVLQEFKIEKNSRFKVSSSQYKEGTSYTTLSFFCRRNIQANEKFNLVIISEDNFPCEAL